MVIGLTDSRNGRYFLFGLLYFVQGTLLAYVLVFNNLYLRQAGGAAWQLSLLNGLLAIPFILKIGIGVMSDKMPLRLPFLGHGYRLPYINLGLFLVAVGSVLTSFIPPVEMFALFLSMAMVIALGLSVYDTVADGLAIDVTPIEEQGMIQGIMVMGRALGFVALAAVYGRLILWVDWAVVFWLIALLSLLPWPWLRHLQEPAQRPLTQQFHWDAVRKLWQPEMRRFFLYALVYSICVYGANAIITLFANEGLGGTLVDVGNVAALGGVGMMIGGLLGTWLNRWAAIWWQGMMTTTAVSATLLIIAGLSNLHNIALMTLGWGISLAMAELVFVTLSMQKSDPRMGAGQFAIFMAVSNVGTGLGQSLSTGLIDTLDFSWIFAILAIVNLLSIPLFQLMRQDAHPR